VPAPPPPPTSLKKKRYLLNNKHENNIHGEKNKYFFEKNMFLSYNNFS
jgi:hypothetical protein